LKVGPHRFPRSSSFSDGRQTRLSAAVAKLLIAACLTLAAGCGKKGDPQAPLPRGPRAVSDLSVEQEGGEAVLTFSYPDRLLTGQALTDLESIEIHRVINPSPALTSPRPAAAASGPKTDEAPGSAARKAAAAVRLAEQAFLRDAQRVFLLPVAALAQHTRGATVVYRDGLGPLLKNGKLPSALAYAVISVRRNGEKSPLSNIVILAPDVPPGPPVILAVTPEEGRICLEWLPPAADMLGRPVEVGGYFVYRRLLPEEEYEVALNSKPSTGTAYVDAGAPQGQLVYTVRAILPNKPKVEGAPADEAPVDYQDIFPPPPPARLDALPEAGLVRLVWDPVTVLDLAGYVVFRAEDNGQPERLNAEPLKESFTTDTSARPGHRYRYTVRAVDKAGNVGAPSLEAIAEPL
jgi:hypothetical protein